MSEGGRRLAAIMFTDMVGYTALSQKNEAGALQLLEEHRKIVRPFFPKHNGIRNKVMIWAWVGLSLEETRRRERGSPSSSVFGPRNSRKITQEDA